MKFTFFNYLCANHYGMHMVRRFKVITMTVCIGYMVAIAFGLAPQLVSLIAVATAGKTILSAIGIGFAICETIAFCQKLGGYKRAVARKFYQVNMLTYTDRCLSIGFYLYYIVLYWRLNC